MSRDLFLQSIRGQKVQEDRSRRRQKNCYGKTGKKIKRRKIRTKKDQEIKTARKEKKDRKNSQEKRKKDGQKSITGSFIDFLIRYR